MITISLEKLTPELVIELTPLFNDHHDEIMGNKGMEFLPDWELYFSLEQLNVFKIFIMRERDIVIGYVSYTVSNQLHYKGSSQASQDALFLSPSHRGKMLGIKLLKHSENALIKLGVKTIFQHANIDNDFTVILKRLKYVEVETVYMKRIG